MNWHESFSVGIRIIDDQHQQLFTLMNELISAVNTCQEDEELDRILHSVRSYTEIHLSTEEKFFKIHPKFQEHCATHQQFAKKISMLAIDLKKNKVDVAAKLIKELTEWLQDHILKTDIAFFRELGYPPKETKEDFEARLQIVTQKVKVLIVEDSPSQRFLLKRNLEVAGFEALEAGDGLEALRILENTYDLHLVITDICMPILDGYSLITAIRDKQIPSVYIIVVTASSDHKSLIKSFQLGANDFLTKPIFQPEMHLRLRNGMNLLRLESQDELLLL